MLYAPSLRCTLTRPSHMKWSDPMQVQCAWMEAITSEVWQVQKQEAVQHHTMHRAAWNPVHNNMSEYVWSYVESSAWGCTLTVTPIWHDWIWYGPNVGEQRSAHQRSDNFTFPAKVLCHCIQASSCESFFSNIVSFMYIQIFTHIQLVLHFVYSLNTEWQSQCLALLPDLSSMTKCISLCLSVYLHTPQCVHLYLMIPTRGTHHLIGHWEIRRGFPLLLVFHTSLHLLLILLWSCKIKCSFSIILSSSLSRVI